MDLNEIVTLDTIQQTQGEPADEPEKPSRVTGSDREDRRALVWDGLLAGKSYRTMGDELGVSRQTVLRDVQVLQRRWVVIAEDTTGHRRLDIARIEKLIRTLWPEALHGGKGGGTDKWAIDRIVSLMERKARYLGLDRPIRHEGSITVEHTTTIDAAIEELLAQFPSPVEASMNGNGDHP